MKARHVMHHVNRFSDERTACGVLHYLGRGTDSWGLTTCKRCKATDYVHKWNRRHNRKAGTP